MLKLTVYSPKGTKLKERALPKKFEEKLNTRLLGQAIHVYRDKKHGAFSKVKTRGEVSLTKAKWYRQKGTGRARHGARSAPLFVGGGKAHGPKGIKRELVLPRKMRQKALAIALSLKVKDKKAAAVSDIVKIKKTQEAQALVNKIAAKANKVTLVLSKENKGAAKFFKNIKRVSLAEFSKLNAYEVFFGGFLIFDNEIFKREK